MTWTNFVVPEVGLAGWHRGGGELLAVVLHGGPGLQDYTEGLGDEVFEAAADRLRVVRYQQRGQPPSTTEGPFSVARFVEDVLAVIDHFGAASAVLVGHSWGAHLAMHAAITEPSRVAGLLIVDALGAVGDGGAGTMGTVIGSRIGEAAVAELAAIDPGLSGVERGTRQLKLLWPGYFADAAAAPPPPAIEYDLDVGGPVMDDAMRMLHDGVLERALPTLTIPSVHVIARHSPIDPAANEKTAALMPGAGVQFVETGHFPWLEELHLMTTATETLLSAVARDASPSGSDRHATG